MSIRCEQGAGSVCLDVINQTWSPMFDLVNVFETFLPQASGGGATGSWLYFAWAAALGRRWAGAG